MDIAKSAGGFIEKIFRTAIAEDASGNADFVPLNAEFFFAFGKGEGDFGHS